MSWTCCLKVNRDYCMLSSSKQELLHVLNLLSPSKQRLLHVLDNKCPCKHGLPSVLDLLSTSKQRILSVLDLFVGPLLVMELLSFINTSLPQSLGLLFTSQNLLLSYYIYKCITKLTKCHPTKHHSFIHLLFI